MEPVLKEEILKIIFSRREYGLINSIPTEKNVRRNWMACSIMGNPNSIDPYWYWHTHFGINYNRGKKNVIRTIESRKEELDSFVNDFKENKDDITFPKWLFLEGWEKLINVFYPEAETFKQFLIVSQYHYSIMVDPVMGFMNELVMRYLDFPVHWNINFDKRKRRQGFTDIQSRVNIMILAGMKDYEIADRLGCGRRNANKHKNKVLNLCRKLYESNENTIKEIREFFEKDRLKAQKIHFDQLGYDEDTFPELNQKQFIALAKSKEWI